MSGPPELGGFSDVDGTRTPDAYADYLDAVRGVPAVAEWKERSFVALRPRPGAALLDVGCGTGDDVLALAPRVAPGGRVTGVDASAAMIAEARRRAAGRIDVDVEFALGDASRLGLPDGSVDGARAERVLLHTGRPADVVVEMARVVRAGGRVVAAEPDWGTLVIDAAGSDYDTDAGRAVAAVAAGRFRSPFVGRTLRRLLIEAGLEAVEVAARTLVVTDRARAEGLFGLTAAARSAVDEGHLSQDRARGWLDGLARAGATGRLLVAMTAFMAAGRRS